MKSTLLFNCYSFNLRNMYAKGREGEWMIMLKMCIAIYLHKTENLYYLPKYQKNLKNVNYITFSCPGYGLCFEIKNQW